MVKKIFTLVALLAISFGAQAKEVVDFFVDFSTQTELKLYGWGGSESARARISLQDGCLYFHSEEVTDPSWDCQFFPAGGVDIIDGVTYTLTVEIKASVEGAGSAIFAGLKPYGQFKFPESSDFVTLTYEYEEAANDDGTGDVLLQCGDFVGEWWIKSIKITHEEVGPQVTLDIPIETGTFEASGDGSTPWENPKLANNDPNFTSVIAWGKENQGDPHPATIEGGAYVVHSTQKAAEDWDNQFWICAPATLQEGDQFTIAFKYKADTPFTAGTQAHANPSNYNFWQMAGDVEFTTEWQQFGPKTYTISADQAGNGKGFNSFCFNLNADGDVANTFYFKDLQVSGTASVINEQTGMFVATDKNGKPVAGTYDADEEYWYAVVGTETDKVSAVWVSLKTGSESLFKANAVKLVGDAEIDPTGEEFLEFTVGGGRAIVLPEPGIWKVMVDDSSAKKSIGFELLSESGIANVTTEKTTSKYIYNLAGQKVNANYKGVVIKNGKKVVVK